MKLFNTRKFNVFLIIVFSSIGQLIAQTATIRGFVYEKESGEPVMFTNVFLKGTTMGAATDVNGYYSISKVPAGDYTISVSALGFEPLNLPISVKANEIVNKKLLLNKGSIDLQTVEISGEKEAFKTEIRTSVVKITPKEIKQVPTIGGEADLAQYLQVLPGVVFTGDQGGQLYIRGGSPIQNKVLMDGMIVYNPFHSIGLFSVFDTDIIKNADVFTGGFNAEYGGRISSIMDIKTRDGNKKRIMGKISGSTFGAKALVEGPLFGKSDDGSGSSFVISAKNSYLDKSSKVFYNYIDSEGLPYEFNDFYGKVSFNSNNGSKINLFGFNYNDGVNYQNVSDLNWKAFGTGSNFILVPGGSPVLIDGNFAYSSYDITMNEVAGQKRNSSISGGNGGFNFTYFLGDNELKYGIEVITLSTIYNIVLPNVEVEENQNSTDFGAYVKYKYVKNKFVFEPSFRLQRYSAFPEFSYEPRLGAKYNVTDKIRIKGSGGYYSQNLMSATSERDVVSLFYGFLTGTDNLQDNFTDEEGNEISITSNLQKANHAILGAEFDLPFNINLNVEVYNKNFTQLTNLNRQKLFEDNSANSSKPDALKKDYVIETGQANGIDFTLKYEYKKLYVWAVYSLSKVDRWDGEENYYPIFDRRHNVNLMTSYNFGKDLNWEFNARWNYGSGFPFTPTQGFYQPIDFNSNGINTNYTTSNIPTNGDPGLQYGKFNSFRLPEYHRLDLTIKRKFVLTTNSILETTASVTNAYNMQNIFYINRLTNQKVYQLPLMPSIGISLTY